MSVSWEIMCGTVGTTETVSIGKTCSDDPFSIQVVSKLRREIKNDRIRTVDIEIPAEIDPLF